MRTRLTVLAAAVLALGAAAPARAAVTPAATATDLRASLGADNHDATGSGTGGRRETDWSEVPDALMAPAFLPPAYYDVQHPRGLVLATPGRGIAVSEDAGGTRTAAPAGSAITDVTFRVPGTDTPALVDGFGADVASGDGEATLQFFAADGSSQGTVTASDTGPSFAGATGDGIARVRITSARGIEDLIWGEPRQPLAAYAFGQAAYAAHENDGTVAVSVRRAGALGGGSVHVATVAGSATAGTDFTAVDKTVPFATGQTEATVSVPLRADRSGGEGDETFTLALSDPEDGVLGTPSTATVTVHDDPPPKLVDRTRPVVGIAGVPRRMSRSRFLRGVRGRVTTNEISSLQLQLLASARRATISRVYGLQLGRKTYARARGTRPVRVKPSRRLVGTARRFKVRLRVLAIDRAGNRRTVTRTISVRG